MVVVYSSSDSYAEIAGISILSLCENNRYADEITFYVLDNGITGANKEKLLSVARQYGRDLKFLTPPDIEATLGMKLAVSKWNIATYFRLFLCTILPVDVDRVIYIDCDTIVRGSLQPLWDLDLGDHWVAAVDDTRADCYKLELGLDLTDTYTNNGIMVIDIAQWRSEDVERQFIEKLIEGGGDFPFVDQGVLNAVLAKQNKVMVLPPKYNAMTFLYYFSYRDLIAFRRPSRPYLTKEEYDQAAQDPVIVHFFPCFMAGTRPWNVRDTHRFTPEYRAYKAMSPWKDVPYRMDERKPVSKLATWICNHIPKGMMLFCASALHARIVPMVRKLKGRPVTAARGMNA